MPSRRARRGTPAVLLIVNVHALLELSARANREILPPWRQRDRHSNIWLSNYITVSISFCILRFAYSNYDIPLLLKHSRYAIISSPGFASHLNTQSKSPSSLYLSLPSPTSFLSTSHRFLRYFNPSLEAHSDTPQYHLLFWLVWLPLLHRDL